MLPHRFRDYIAARPLAQEEEGLQQEAVFSFDVDFWKTVFFFKFHLPMKRVVKICKMGLIWF